MNKDNNNKTAPDSSDDRIKVTKSVFQVAKEEQLKKQAELDEKQRELMHQHELQERQKQEAYEKQILEEKKELMRLKQGLIEESDTIREVHEEAAALSFPKKIQNFFYHNKWWLGIGIIIAFIVGYLIYSWATRPRPDIIVTVVGTDTMVGTSSGLADYIEEFTPDNNNNGKLLCSLVFIQTTDNGYSNYANGSDSKLTTQFQSADSMIVIGGQKLKELVATENLFMDLSEIFPDDPKMIGYYFYLKDTKFAEVTGIDPKFITSDMYIAIRKPQKLLYSSEDEMQEAYERDLPVFKAIINDLRSD